MDVKVHEESHYNPIGYLISTCNNLDADITLTNDKSVSRTHATIEVSDCSVQEIVSRDIVSVYYPAILIAVYFIGQSGSQDRGDRH